MTAQALEEIIVDGVQYDLMARPLDAYLDTLNPCPNMADLSGFHCSALWRGYIGVWELQADRLFLQRLRGGWSFDEGGEVPDIDLSRIFPDGPRPIPAIWYSGKLSLPLGPMLQYVHMGWGSFYQFERIIYVHHGRVARVRHVDHTARFLAACDEARLFAPRENVEGCGPLHWLTDEGREIWDEFENIRAHV